MRKRMWVMVACLAGVAGAAEQQGETKDLAEDPEVRGALRLLDRWIDAYQVYEELPSLVAGVVLDQELVFARGYGLANVRRKVAADEHTLYSICSISKLFTSIALMQQRDAGRLSLDDAVADHIDWFRIGQSFPKSGPVTVRALLTHSSGLPRESVNHYWNPDYPFPDREHMIEALSSQTTLYPADRYFQYSNLALTLVGEIAAAKAGKPYADVVQDDILTPLGLGETRPYLPRELHGTQMAIGYGAPNRAGEREPEPPFDTAGITPAAGFTSSVADLARFASWQFRLLENGGEEVLRASTLAEMQRVHWVDPDWKTTWGLGFAVSKYGEGDTLVGHGGGCPGYITAFTMLPKHKLAVIVLTNAADAEPDRVADNAYKLLGPALKAAKSRKAEEAFPDFSAYEGLYDSRPWVSEVAIVQIGKHLTVARLPSNDPSEGLGKLKHVEGDVFRRVREDGDDPGETWTFDRDDSGAVTAVRYHGLRMTRRR